MEGNSKLTYEEIVRRMKEVLRVSNDSRLLTYDFIMRYGMIIYMIEAFIIEKERIEPGVNRNPHGFKGMITMKDILQLGDVIPREILQCMQNIHRSRNASVHSREAVRTEEFHMFLNSCNLIVKWFFLDYMEDTETYNNHFKNLAEQGLARYKDNENCKDIVSEEQEDENLDYLIGQIFSLTDFPDNVPLGMIAQKIEKCCQRILEDVLKKENIEIRMQRGFVVNGIRYPSLVTYIIERKPQFIPIGCIQFLNTIRLQRNYAAHEAEYPAEALEACGKAFDGFVLWYYIYYCGDDDKYDEIIKYRNKFSSGPLQKKANVPDLMTELTEEQLNFFVSKFSARLYEYIQPDIDYLKRGVEDANRKLDLIETAVNSIVNCISNYQELMERQLGTVGTEEEKNRLMQIFTDECVDKINQSLFAAQSQKEYSKHRLALEIRFDSAWNKLSEQSKAFLISSKVMYNTLLDLGNIVDYSGVCIMITKAFEVELFRRLFKEYTKYLEEQFPIAAKGDKWPKSLVNVSYYSNQASYCIKKDKDITLGNYPYIMGVFPENCRAPEDERMKEHSKKIFYQFAKEKLFLTIFPEQQIQELIQKYAYEIDEITRKYRNPSAHKNELRLKSASECFDYVIEVQRVLGNMLDSFRF